MVFPREREVDLSNPVVNTSVFIPVFPREREVDLSSFVISFSSFAIVFPREREVDLSRNPSHKTTTERRLPS